MSEANLTELYHVAGTGICKHILEWVFDAPMALAFPHTPFHSLSVTGIILDIALDHRRKCFRFLFESPVD